MYARLYGERELRGLAVSKFLSREELHETALLWSLHVLDELLLDAVYCRESLLAGEEQTDFCCYVR